MASNSSKKMRAAILSQHKGLLEIKELPIPVPASNEILIKIKASGCDPQIFIIL